MYGQWIISLHTCASCFSCCSCCVWLRCWTALLRYRSSRSWTLALTPSSSSSSSVALWDWQAARLICSWASSLKTKQKRFPKWLTEPPVSPATHNNRWQSSATKDRVPHFFHHLRSGFTHSGVQLLFNLINHNGNQWLINHIYIYLSIFGGNPVAAWSDIISSADRRLPPHHSPCVSWWRSAGWNPASGAVLSWCSWCYWCRCVWMTGGQVVGTTLPLHYSTGWQMQRPDGTAVWYPHFVMVHSSTYFVVKYWNVLFCWTQFPTFFIYCM